MSRKQQFVVEKIMDKRMRCNKVEYLLKWEGYGDDENTWETESSLDCPDLLIKYERSLIEKQRKLSGKDNKRNSSKNSNSSQLSSDESTSFEINKIELPNPNGEIVQQILGAQMANGELNLLIKFKYIPEPRFVPTKIANLKYPQEIIKFYEKCINWEFN